MSGLHAIFLATQRKKKLEMEEDEMTKYTREELDHDWEFKIVFNAKQTFRKPDVFQQIVEEEALAGWQLLE